MSSRSLHLWHPDFGLEFDILYGRRRAGALHTDRDRPAATFHRSRVVSAQLLNDCTQGCDMACYLDDFSKKKNGQTLLTRLNYYIILGDLNNFLR